MFCIVYSLCLVPILLHSNLRLDILIYQIHVSGRPPSSHRTPPLVLTLASPGHFAALTQKSVLIFAHTGVATTTRTHPHAHS